MKKKEMLVLHVDITTWTGISIGATHYYGKIEFPYKVKRTKLGMPIREEKDVELKYNLTRTDVENLNRKEKMYASTYRATYHVGDASSRFDNKEAIKIAAKKYYDENLKKKYPMIVFGRSSVIEPQEIIGYNFKDPEKIKLVEEINKIAKEYKYNEDCDSEINGKLGKKWAPLWKKLTGQAW